MTTTPTVIRIGKGYRRHATADGVTGLCGKTGPVITDYTHVGPADCDQCTGRAQQMRRYA